MKKVLFIISLCSLFFSVDMHSFELKKSDIVNSQNVLTAGLTLGLYKKVAPTFNSFRAPKTIAAVLPFALLMNLTAQKITQDVKKVSGEIYPERAVVAISTGVAAGVSALFLMEKVVPKLKTPQAKITGCLGILSSTLFSSILAGGYIINRFNLDRKITFGSNKN